MSSPKGKLIAIGGAEHKGTTLEVDGFQTNNLNFFELGILRRVVEEEKIQGSDLLRVVL